MHSKQKIILGIAFVTIFMTARMLMAVDEPSSAISEETPKIGISEDMGETLKKEAAKVKEDLEQRTRSLFERDPLGWDMTTIDYLYREGVKLPLKVPDVTHYILKESRTLGLIGSLLVLLFIIAVLYSLFGQKRVFKGAERIVQPVLKLFPESYYPYFQSGLKVLVFALIPLILLGLFSLIHAMIAYRASWFQLTGRLLGLWAIGAVIMNVLRELLKGGLFEVTAQYGKTLFRWARLVFLYILLGVAVSWTLKTFHIRPDALAFINFIVFASIIVFLFQLFIRKKAFMSLFPDLASRSYREFVKILSTLYYPLMIVSLVAALLWCFGYEALGQIILIKIWFTTAAFLLIILLYHTLSHRLREWRDHLDLSNDTALFLARALRSVLLYTTIVAAGIIILNLLGLLNPLQLILSFPIFHLGDASVSLWIIIKAVLILLGFVVVSRLLEAFLDYKVYPAVGIEPGFGYALNTLFKYASLVIGFFISLNIVGISLRFLLVFAGAIGIGVGLGLQNTAANVISGFTIIFGGKIRKGDWIEVGGTLGSVTDIYLRATKVRTRDNIEYLIPNSDLISQTIVNYSLSSPMIRVDLPVGASYGSDPREVERIMLEVAKREPLVSKYKDPVVRFTEYADSSINFQLLFWIDVRNVPRRLVRSALYFAIFDEFKKAGIEIPFPQRDVHIRSKVQ
ncbi:MAG: mechanosensitive ion channel [Deltaproteobacteria bacterium]|nr:mechanosensitive ion channel [Deltaproteobacteria bacterium]